MKPIRTIRRLACILAGLAAVGAAARPAALASTSPGRTRLLSWADPPLPPGWNKHPPLPASTHPALKYPPGWNKHPPFPAHVHALATGGMPGWPITLIAAAVLAAAAVLLVARAHAARRRAAARPATHAPSGALSVIGHGLTLSFPAGWVNVPTTPDKLRQFLHASAAKFPDLRAACAVTTLAAADGESQPPNPLPKTRSSARGPAPERGEQGMTPKAVTARHCYAAGRLFRSRAMHTPERWPRCAMTQRSSTW